MKKTKKKRKFKSFHPVRQFRISHELFKELNHLHKETGGTWNYFFEQIIKNIDPKKLKPLTKQKYGTITKRSPESALGGAEMGRVRQTISDGKMDAS